MVFFSFIISLLLVGISNAGEAVCDPRVSTNTTNCACAEGDERCTFSNCIDGCTCPGGACVMNFCLTKCICPLGDCRMPSCLNSCDNGGDATPPICYSTEELDPTSRGDLTPIEVCSRDHGQAEAWTPYVCTEGVGYACCTVDVDTISHSVSMDLGSCTKDLEIKGGVVAVDEKFDTIEEARYRTGNNNIGNPASPSAPSGISVGFITGVLCMLFMISIGGFTVLWRKGWVPSFNKDAKHQACLKTN